MNRTYRSIRIDKRESFALKGLAASLMLAFGSSAYALPSGGAVSAGGATIASGAGTMTINQSSQNVALNWQSFGIGQGEAVRFVQPNSNSVALNRVLGSDPSNILGSLSANGKVFLVNPNGIMFAKGAQVNVGGLVASTRSISDSDFMAGNYKFAGTGNGTVVNHGSINADGGYVALLGASVSNEGVISARLGTVALAAGNAITIDVAGDGLLNVAVNQGALNALAHNGGLIQAGGGQVLLTAVSAGNLLQSAVNNTGVIQAQTVENHNGTIRLLGDMQSGTVSVGGTLDASGTGAGQTGGNIVVAGHHVGLFDGHINASGDVGGGTVLIGGGFQGNNPAVPNASATYMSANSTINVDAITNGNGGTAVLWANDSTRAYGGITARGGALGGNGGLIETSAHWLDVAGIGINASAPNGKSGMWLLDPADITISAGGTAGMPPLPVAGVFAPDPSLGSTTLNTTDLRNALQAGGGTDVTVTTINTGAPGTPLFPSLGDITVADPLTWVIGVARSATLTLSAAGNVNIDAAVNITRGNLVVCCGQDINVRAPITVASASGGGGSVLLSAGRDITVFATPGAITVTDGNITLCAGHDVNVLGKITLTQTTGIDPILGLGLSRGLVLSAGNAATGPGPAGGTVTLPVGAVNPLRPSVTGESVAAPAPVTISYNPASYLAGGQTDYSGSLILVDAVLTQFMLVFPDVVPKIADGSTAATLSGFKTTGVSGSLPLTVALAPGGTANFATALPGNDQIVTFSGVSLAPVPIVAGGTGINFALPAPCCGVLAQTTGSIIAPPPPPGSTPGGTTDSTVIPVPIILPAFYPYTVLAGLNLDVGGITMPPIQVAEIPAVESAPLSGFTDTPIVVPPVYVPPPILRRPDRN